jgi:hypothetical protein
MSKKEVNFECIGKTILVKPISEVAGLDLSFMKESPLAMEVFGVGDEVTKVSVGEMVVCIGSFLSLNIDDIKYFQLYESQIMGKVKNGGKVTINNPEPASQF